MRNLDEHEHLVFEGLGTATDSGGAGGMGSGALAPGSTRAVTGAGSSSAALLAGFSGAAWVTLTMEESLAMRGSRRVMLTEETAGGGGAMVLGSS